MLIVPRMMPRFSPCQRAQVRLRVDDVGAGAARAEVRATADLGRVVGQLVGIEQIPLNAEFCGLVGRDLHDQRFDKDLRAANIELVDDSANIVVQGFGRHHEQGVVGSVCLYCHAGCGKAGSIAGDR